MSPECFIFTGKARPACKNKTVKQFIIDKFNVIKTHHEE